MTDGKQMTFDTDYGIVGMSVNPSVSEKDFDFGKSSLKDDGDCGSTFDLATKSFVLSAISSKISELVEKVALLEKRVSELENVKNPK